jgi:glycosyltransferase involved in cell wall biosynthesis
MKILLVGDYPNDPRLGSAKVPHKLCEEFRALGHQCDMLFAEDIGDFPRQSHLRQALRPAAAARAIGRAFLARGPYDVIDVASAEGFIFGLRRRLGDYSGTVFVSRSNGLEHLNYRRMLDDHRAGLLHKPWTRRLWYPAVRLTQVEGAARLADKFILLNEGDRAYALRRGWKREGDIVVVPHGISERFLTNEGARQEGRGEGILFCGTWDNTKGIQYLTRAYSRLLEIGPATKITLLGGGVPAEQVLSAFPEGMRRLVTVIPKVPEEEVMRQFRRHDLLMFCSTYEGFGMVVVEAMSQGLPVVATPVGCTTAFVKDGETGLVVPPRDAEALAVAARRMLNDAALRRRVADNASQLVGNLTWRSAALKTIGVYESAMR